MSDLADFAEGTSFHRVLWDTDRDQLSPGKNIKRVVLCTGKVYYDLLQARRDRGIKDVMIVRVEQLYPFPALSLAQELKEYPNAEVVWCQEEPQNMGYWSFVEPRIERVLTELKHKTSRARYAGRVEAASPATGYMKRHNDEQAKLVDEALKV